MTDQVRSEGEEHGPRRRARRLQVQLAGRLAGRQAHPVRVIDISQTGCLVQCPASLDMGAILDLEVEVGAEKISAKVRVAAAALDGDAAEATPLFLTGLEFLGLAARDSAKLRCFLDDEARRRRGADAPSG